MMFELRIFSRYARIMSFQQLRFSKAVKSPDFLLCRGITLSHALFEFLTRFRFFITRRYDVWYRPLRCVLPPLTDGISIVHAQNPPALAIQDATSDRDTA